MSTATLRVPSHRLLSPCCRLRASTAEPLTTTCIALVSELSIFLANGASLTSIHSISSSRLLLLLLLLCLLLLPLRLNLLQFLLLMESRNLSLQLVLLHDEVVARDLELRDDFFGRGLLVASALLEVVSNKRLMPMV